MLPLKIAILWHQHQPYYKINGKYQLPWVRLHGIKDYYDLPSILFDYPGIKQTFNIVPSMIMQVEDYANNDVNESILNLTRKRADALSTEDKTKILKSFFICNEQNMILPYPRFAELFKRSKTAGIDDFQTQDWLDLQVWYNLTWFGQNSRQHPVLKYLLAKGKNFTEEDKQLMLATEKEILQEIIPTMKRLRDMGNIEISVSPMFHPIMPLLIDTESSKEAMPEKEVPEPPFRFPQDAEWHLNKAVTFFKEKFGSEPDGLWPSEGSISNKTLEFVARNGFKWLATDEEIMMQSFNNSINRLERFFPRRLKTAAGDLAIFFRDRLLSDLIGFNYANMNHEDAAKDFINRLKYVRWEISSHYGEDSLNYAVVPVILDGENCWEFYKDNGKPFLDALFTGLSNDEQLQTVTFSEAMDEKSLNFVKEMNSVRAGSWINANFDIWIGQKEHIRAWNALRDARSEIEDAKDIVDNEKLQAAFDEIHIAEGSDWFWWYHDSHQAPNKHDFDIMFRDLLKNVYTFLGKKYPDYLDKPFGKVLDENVLTQAENTISPDLDNFTEEHWKGAGIFRAYRAMDAMHSAADILYAVHIGNDDKKIYFRIDLKRSLEDDENIEIKITNPFEFSIIIDGKNAKDTTLFDYCYRKNAEEIKLKIIANTKNGIMQYPRSGSIKLTLI